MNHQDTKTPRERVSDATDLVATEIVDASLSVHKTLGPGLLEGVYETCLAFELRGRGLNVETQISLPVMYKGVRLDGGLRIDLIVERAVLVELKAVDALLPVHHAQVLTYLKLSGFRLGFLINFNVPLIKDGIKRFVL